MEPELAEPQTPADGDFEVALGDAIEANIAAAAAAEMPTAEAEEEGQDIMPAAAPHSQDADDAGEVEGFRGSLLDAIDCGEVDPPELLAWREWQRWRNLEGRRPPGRAIVHGGAGPEARLWKATMAEFFGDGWRLLLAAPAPIGAALPVFPSLGLQPALAATPHQPLTSALVRARTPVRRDSPRRHQDLIVAKSSSPASDAGSSSL
jgi:hypothetical protein